MRTIIIFYNFVFVQVRVTVTDVNDNHPEFKQRSYEYIIEENVLSPGISVTATDADSGENGRITYSLVKSPGKNDKTCYLIPKCYKNLSSLGA